MAFMFFVFQAGRMRPITGTTGGTKAGRATGSKISASYAMMARTSDRRNFMSFRSCSTNPARDSLVPKPFFVKTAWYLTSLSRIVDGNDLRNAKLHWGSSTLVASISGVAGMGVNRLSLPLHRKHPSLAIPVARRVVSESPLASTSLVLAFLLADLVLPLGYLAQLPK